jgi:hypothetical protein
MGATPHSPETAPCHTCCLPCPDDHTGVTRTHWSRDGCAPVGDPGQAAATPNSVHATAATLQPATPPGMYLLLLEEQRKRPCTAAHSAGHWSALTPQTPTTPSRWRQVATTQLDATLTASLQTNTGAHATCAGQSTGGSPMKVASGMLLQPTHTARNASRLGS